VFFEDRLEQKRIIWVWIAQEPNIDGASVQSFDLRRGRHLDQLGPGVGKLAAIFADNLGDDGQGDRGRERGTKLARLSSPGAAGRIKPKAELFENTVRRSEKEFPRLSLRSIVRND
jgi:hypothetical protein